MNKYILTMRSQGKGMVYFTLYDLPFRTRKYIGTVGLVRDRSSPPSY